ncbi:MAG: TusE/DsrC/DsvC family sulfur relay protein [Syntrophobacteraceae bacterium]|nr:TusE/DsrC/DsvC family sulfur relay protein [Syntrophobacteraceae bacterium]
MQTFERKNKTYRLDDDGFLLDQEQWDENFAEGMAPELGITGGLTPSHWDVLRFIRDACRQTGSCPVVHKTCRANGLSVKDLQRLFPSGYQRGACKLAGLSCMTVVLKPAELQFRQEENKISRMSCATAGATSPISPTQKGPVKHIPLDERVYRVNVQGFLIDPDEWDEEFAICKAVELQMYEPLGDKHWQIIWYMRSEYERSGVVPTVYATCEAVGIEMEELAQLFPPGYHRGAVKLAGLNLTAKRRATPQKP